MQQIIVDGYNVLHASAASIRRKGSLESRRLDLVAEIRRYVSVRGVRVTVVFDGAGGMIDADVVVPGKLQVLYSRTGQSADELIIDTLQRHANPREFIVVTNDIADIGRRASAMGARVMRSEDFLARISQRGGGPDGESGGEKPQEDAIDVDYWLELFGEGDEGTDVK